MVLVLSLQYSAAIDEVVDIVVDVVADVVIDVAVANIVVALCDDVVEDVVDNTVVVDTVQVVDVDCVPQISEGLQDEVATSTTSRPTSPQEISTKAIKDILLQWAQMATEG